MAWFPSNSHHFDPPHSTPLPWEPLSASMGKPTSISSAGGFISTLAYDPHSPPSPHCLLFTFQPLFAWLRKWSGRLGVGGGGWNREWLTGKQSCGVILHPHPHTSDHFPGQINSQIVHLFLHLQRAKWLAWLGSEQWPLHTPYIAPETLV